MSLTLFKEFVRPGGTEFMTSKTLNWFFFGDVDDDKEELKTSPQQSSPFIENMSTEHNPPRTTSKPQYKYEKPQVIQHI